MRTAGRADQQALNEALWLAVHWRSEKPPPMQRDELPARAWKYADNFGREGDFGVVAEAGGRAVGAAWWRYFSAEDRGYGFVAEDVPELSLAVTPRHRRCGVGRSLLAALHDQARLQRLPGLSLSVEPDNPALKLYRSAGYKRVGHVDTAWTMLWRTRQEATVAGARR